jgi:HD-GYP domain-containing protein (c-di-GMP phosphodiesterase class II)
MAQSQEVKIRVFDLEVGMYVCRLDKDWTETSYPLQGFLIESDNQIQKLIDECEYVYIDAARKRSENSPRATSGNASPSHANSQAAQAPVASKKHPSLHHIAHPKSKEAKKTPLFSLHGLLKLLAGEPGQNRKQTNHLDDIVLHKLEASEIEPPRKLVPVTKEFDFARRVHAQANILLKKFMSEVREGEPLNMFVAEQSIHNCILSALRSPDALLLVAHLYKKHLTIWQHSMRVSVLAISLGRFLNLSDKELTILGLCGMLHDIGSLLISK